MSKSGWVFSCSDPDVIAAINKLMPFVHKEINSTFDAAVACTIVAKALMESAVRRYNLDSERIAQKFAAAVAGVRVDEADDLPAGTNTMMKVPGGN